MPDLLDRLKTALADRYAIEREIGAGGMATVYLAEDLKLHRKVAVKVLRPELAAALGPERFLREIEIAAKLHHPHILALHDSGEADGFLYYVMPYVEGESLRDRLHREKQLPVEDALQIAREVADALGSAHRHDVIHRDIKPENILLEEGHAVVADFGIARAIHAAGGEQLTETGLAVGTPAYMSPEQAMGSKELDGRSDLYSLGCVLYEMLGGEPPFTGATVESIVHQQIAVEPRPVTELRPAVPAEVVAALSRVLSKAPADRFSPAAQFAEALAKRESAAVVATPMPKAGWLQRTTGYRRVRRSTVIGAMLLIATALVFSPSVLDRMRSGDSLGETSFEQVTRESGSELFPSLSADGGSVVFARAGDLHLRRLDDGTERRITSSPTDDNTQPAFSPDDQRVAFRSERDGGGIFAIDTDGGELTRLSNFGYNPTWSPDGQYVLFASEGVAEPSTRRSMSHLFTIDVTTREQKQLGDVDAVQPSWSPNGHRIAYWSVARDGQLTSQRDLWTMRADGTDPLRVTDDAPVDWNPVWSADGEYLLFSSDRGGSMNLWSIRIDEKSGQTRGSPRPITSGGTASQEHIAVARSGSRALYVERLTTSNIFKVAFDSDRGIITGEPIPVTQGSLMAVEPSVSPDGRWVTFYTLDESLDLYVAETDGSGMRQLTDGPSSERSPQWSPDGKHIVFHADLDGRYQIWRTDPDGTDFTKLTNSGGLTIYPFWSPDSRRVGFVELGRGVSVVDVSQPESVPEMLVPGDLMVRPAWSPQGTSIAGVLPPAAGGSGIVVYTLDSRSVETISQFGDAPQWLPDGRRIVFAWKNRLYLTDVRSKQVRELLSFGRDLVGLGSISADGSWIFFSKTVTEADLWSVEWER